MKTVVLGDPPPVLVSLIAERRRLGVDTHDEVWNGEYHMAPAASFEHAHSGGAINRLLGPAADAKGLQVSLEFNLGSPDNYRVPDLGVHRGKPSGVWIATAAIVVEVRSPDDESYEKFDFFADHGVEEILIADLATKTVTWFARGPFSAGEARSEAKFLRGDRSSILDLSAAEVAAALGW
jgi:Putative restriction endonuclease